MAYGQGGWPAPPGGGYGGPPGPHGPPGPGAWPGPGYGAPQPQGASGQATLALVLAIIGWVACGCFTSLPAVFIAKSELGAIQRGEAPMAGKGMAEAAFWVGLVNAIIWVLVGLVYVVLIAVGVVASATAGP